MKNASVTCVKTLMFCPGMLMLLATSSVNSLSTKFVPSRRAVIKHLVGSIGCGLLVSSSQDVAEAACLPGDQSKECIGVYKVPIDDSVLPYVSTPEALKLYAPDINYVPPVQSPKSFEQAIELLSSQRTAADDIQQVVSAGKLEEAGIKVLNLLPKVTTSGKLVVSTLQAEIEASSSVNNGENKDGVIEMKLLKLNQQLDLVLYSWGECDILIGQGLRGELGVSAVAQIQILSSLRDATAALDDFLAVASRRTG